MPDYRELIGAFRDQTRLDEGQADRIRARLGRPSPRKASWVLAAAGIAAMLGVGLLTRPPAPVAGPLATGSLTEDVQLAVAGEGTALGTTRDMSLAWERGTLSVEVRPDQGIHLSVHTEDATVAVVGTGFTVTRDALGTAIAVRHGRVAVDCTTGAHTELGAGQSQTCAPASAAGRLGRVRALQEAGANPQDLLTEVTAALALPDAQGSVASELASVQLDALLALDRDADALALAERLAAEGGPRALEQHRVAARLRLRRSGTPDCTGALPHLHALADAGRLDADAPWFSLCNKESP